MLTIGAMTAGQNVYYQNLAREDYYIVGGEPEGVWLGSGAQRLSLSGRVNKDALSSLFEGFSLGGEPLVQNAGKASRQPGWDLTFSCPKSVSFLWSQLPERERQIIQEAHAAAVSTTMSYIEKYLAFSRVGQGGKSHVPVGLVTAVFEHGCSRAFDMQLHSHVLVMNIGIDSQGVSRSILSKPLYQAKMLAGAYYRCELAKQLQERLGLELERPATRHGKSAWFEVKGISPNILSHFSKRREAILQELGKRGLESASAAAVAALGTRDPKAIVPPRSELHAQWQFEGRELGFELPKLFQRSRKYSPKENQRRFEAAVNETVANITASNNYFSRSTLLRRTLEESQELGISAELVVQEVERCLATDANFISLGSHRGESLWTTQEILSLESEFQQSVAALRSRSFGRVSDRTVSEVLCQPRVHDGAQYYLTAEQQSAVRYMTQGSEAVKCVSGFPGSGKTDILAAAREILEKEGYRVIGTALAGVAARTLETQTGIESDTIRMRESQLAPAAGTILRHHAQQLWRAACGRPTFSLSELKIDERTILVIDEAGMVGVRDFAQLTKAVVEQGGSLIAVGDERQLAAIERPGAFEYLTQELDGANLSEIRRQKDPADREAVKDIVRGDPRSALHHYASKGQLCVTRRYSQAEEELVSDWAKHGGTTNPSDHRIFASTTAQVDRLNQLCQWERVRSGIVNAQERVEHEGMIFMAGDSVRFGRPSRQLGIRKGESGTILATKNGLTGKYVSIALDDVDDGKGLLATTKFHARQMLNLAVGRQIEQPLRRDNLVVVPLATLNPMAKTYEGLALDYAMTTHLGQGLTVENSYVLLGGSMASRELTYVQVSRHRDSLRLYTTEEAAGKELADLARQYRPIDRNNQSRRDTSEQSKLIHQIRNSHVQELAFLVPHQSPSLIHEDQHVQQ